MLKYYIDNGYLPDVNNIALIPAMTSNTTPSGVVSASSFYGVNYEAFRAFDKKTESRWNSNGNGTSEWIQYKFANPVNAKEITYSNVTDGVNGAQNSGVFKLQVSSNGSDWVDVSGTITQSNGSVTFEHTQIQYVRCLQVGGSNGLAVNEIQVYG